MDTEARAKPVAKNPHLEAMASLAEQPAEVCGKHEIPALPPPALAAAAPREPFREVRRQEGRVNRRQADARTRARTRGEDSQGVIDYTLNVVRGDIAAIVHGQHFVALESAPLEPKWLRKNQDSDIQ